MKILINGPSSNMKNMGGVANHIHGLKMYWSTNVCYNTIGNRGTKSGLGIFWLPWDVIKFIISVLIQRPDYVWVNPSIAANALKRDFLFVNIAKAFGVKVAIFIHGFDLANFAKMDKGWLTHNLNKASFIMVLAHDFKKRLVDIGVTAPIELTTTKVEDSLISGFDINKKDYRSRNLLFLARVEKAKGIYETIDAYAILKRDYEDLTLQISGGGSELEPAKEYVKSKGIPDITFTGFIAADDIKKSFSNSLLLLLTSHGEGMPTNVLEGMAFGLPIVTRPVGGLADFFKNGEMGFISESLDPDVFAQGMRHIIDDIDYAKKIGHYNFQYAKEYFYASSVAQNIEKLFEKYL